MTLMPNFRGKHLIALIIALFLWGTSFPALRVVVRTHSPLKVLFFRYLFSLILVIGLAAVRRKQVFKRLMQRKKLLWLGVFNAMGSWLQFKGMQYTTATKSAVLTQLLVVAVPVLAWFILKERLNRWKTAGIVSSLLGAVLLSTNLQLRGLLLQGSLKGDALTLASVVFWGLFIVYTRQWVNQEGILLLLFANYLGVLLVSAPLMFVAGSFSLDTQGLEIIIFLTIFCTVFPTMLYNYSLKFLDAVTSAIIGPLEMISAVILAWIILGEKLTFIGFFGSMLILFSLYLVGRSEIHRRVDKNSSIPV